MNPKASRLPSRAARAFEVCGRRNWKEMRMGRLPGSIDQRKKDAVLEVAAPWSSRARSDASLRLIAKRSGVAKQTIYNYFGDKPGLFQALLDSRAGPTECPTCAYPMKGAPASFFSAYAKTLLEWLRRLRLAAGLRAVISPDRFEPSTGPTAWRHRRRTGDAGAGPGLAEAAHRGRLRIDDPEDAAGQFLNLVTAGRFCGGVPAISRGRRGGQPGRPPTPAAASSPGPMPRTWMTSTTCSSRTVRRPPPAEL
jgi:AcrR family transcriptional regulator